MFSSLLKYEIKTTAPLMLAMTGMGAVFIAIMLSVKPVQGVANLVAWQTFLSLFFVLAVGMVPLLLVWQFYQSLFSQEGMFLLSLPVSTTKIIMSKLCNAMLWIGLVRIVAHYGIMAVYQKNLLLLVQNRLASELVFTDSSGVNISLWLFFVLANALAMFIYYVAISLGQLSRKYPFIWTLFAFSMTYLMMNLMLPLLLTFSADASESSSGSLYSPSANLLLLVTIVGGFCLLIRLIDYAIKNKTSYI